MGYAKITVNVDPRIKHLFEGKYPNVSDRVRELISLDLFGGDVGKHPDYARMSRVGKPSKRSTPKVAPLEAVYLDTQRVFPWVGSSSKGEEDEGFSETLLGDEGGMTNKSVGELLRELESSSNRSNQG